MMLWKQIDFGVETVRKTLPLSSSVLPEIAHTLCAWNARRQTILSVFVCLYILVAPGTFAETTQSRTSIKSAGETVVAAKSEKLNVQAKIITHEVQIGKPSEKRGDVSRFSCTYSRYPCSVVDTILIEINGKPITVPRSVFCDLADLNTAELRIGQDESILMLIGGDASEGYVAAIEFNSAHLQRRSLSSAMSPNEPLQETIYFRRILGD